MRHNSMIYRLSSRLECNKILVIVSFLAITVYLTVFWDDIYTVVEFDAR